MTSPLPTAVPASASPEAPFSFRRHVLPHLLAVLAFLLLTVIYFSPIFFEHKTLVQSDVLQFKGSAHEIEQWRQQTGHQPLWTNSMFSGMPTYLIQTRFPGDLSQYLSSLFTLGLPTAAANLFLMQLCAYVLFAAIGTGPLLAGAGAIMAAFATYNMLILEAGHNTKSMAIAYAPLVIAGVLVAFRRNRWLGGALFTLGLTMNVRSNHPQITYYLALMLGIYVLIELVSATREKRLPAFLTTVAMLGAGALIAVGVSFGRLYTTTEYTKYSIRGKSELTTPLPGATEQAHQGSGLDRSYAFAYSQGIPESITLLVPDFFGGAHNRELGAHSATASALRNMGAGEEQVSQYLMQMPVYWGDSGSIDGPIYLGAVTFFLFILGLLIVERRLSLWLLATALLGLMLAWGKNFESLNYFLFDYLPGYNKFRAISMAVVLPQLAMPLLAVLAAWYFLRGIPAVRPLPGLGGATAPAASDAAFKALRTATLATVGVLVLLLLAGLMTDPVGGQDAELAKQNVELVRALRDDRVAMLRNDIFRALGFVLAAAAVLYFALRRTLSVPMAALSLLALTLVDQWSVDKRHVNDRDFQENVVQTHFEPTPADQQILQDKDLSYRVLNLQNPFNDGRTSYFHKSIGGYHGAKMRRYQDLIERQMSQNNTRMFDMLNARYIIPGDPRQPVQRNPTALGNAWLVQEVKLVRSPDEEMAALTSLQPGTTAVVDASKFPDVKAATYQPTGSVRLTSYAPDKLTYAATLDQPGVAVFSEIYYADGWDAFIDGKPAPYFRADYVLRAMSLPAGQHTVEFRFEPKQYAIGNTISLISSVLLLLAVAAGVAYGLRLIRRTGRPALA